MKKSYLIEEDFEYKGFRCAVIGQELGHRCGYVGLPNGHRYYGVRYTRIPVKCHGELTYGLDNPNYPVANNEGLYWIGFDCAHYGDAKDPALLKIFGQQINPYLSELFSDGVVWTQEMVEGEIKRIVDQLLMLQDE